MSPIDVRDPRGAPTRPMPSFATASAVEARGRERGAGAIRRGEAEAGRSSAAASRGSCGLSRSAIDRMRRSAADRPDRGVGRGGRRAAPRSALARATRGSSWMPMTSPVDCMDGPTDGSTPRSLVVENAGAFTATNGGGGRSPPGQPSSASVGAERDPHGELDHRHAGDLRQERHGARRPRVDLDQVDAVLADDELGVDEAARAEGEHDALHRRHDQPWSASLTDCGGNMPTESPECTPARSTCSSSPGIRTRSPSETASTSTSMPSR